MKYKGFQGFEKRRGEGNGSMVRRKGGIQWFQWFERRRGARQCVMRKGGMQWLQSFERRREEGDGSMVTKEGMEWFQSFDRRRGEWNGLNGLRGKGEDARHGFHCLRGVGGNEIV